MNTTNTTHCLLQCYSTDWITEAHNVSLNLLQSLQADQVTQSTDTTRTLWNIVWSSLTTIFACTWVACHPNISFDNDKLKKEDETRWWRRCWGYFQISTASIKIMLVALIGPEFMIVWAIRQYNAAKKLVSQNQGLTMTHAFFSLMGGFVLVDKGREPIHVLVGSPPRSDYQYIHDRVRLAVEADDVKARVKVDVMASVKDSVTSYANSVNSRSETAVDAAVEIMVNTLTTVALETALESDLCRTGFVDSLSKTLLNAITGEASKAMEIVKEECNAEGIWDDVTWERVLKKKSVDDRLRDQLRHKTRSIGKAVEESIQDKSKRDSLAKLFTLAQVTWFSVQFFARTVLGLPLTQIELTASAYAGFNIYIYIYWLDKPFRVNFPIIIRTEKPHKEEQEQEINTSERVLQLSNIDTLMGLVSRLLNGSIYDDTAFTRRLQVPTFFSDYFGEGYHVVFLFIGFFGGIHLFAWNYEFPTRIELWIWRVSALIITGGPLLMVPITSPIMNICKSLIRWEYDSSIPKAFFLIFFLSYITARLSILVLSLISLRRLPAGVFTNIDWLALIPHID